MLTSQFGVRYHTRSMSCAFGREAGGERPLLLGSGKVFVSPSCLFGVKPIYPQTIVPHIFPGPSLISFIALLLQVVLLYYYCVSYCAQGIIVVMAFFGLTALGPQNSFQVSLLDFSYLDVFTAADIEKAFNVVDQDNRGFLDKSDQVNRACLSSAQSVRQHRDRV